jgi:hypothetical protein
LLAHDRHLEPATRLLAAQIALVADDTALCARQLDLLGNEARRPAQLLRVRQFTSERRHGDAEQLARTLWEAEHEQESATLLAEALAGQHRYAEALAMAEHADLTGEPSIERGLIAALLALEVHGDDACLVRLGRIRPDRRPGLVRILAAAWPCAWGERIQVPVEPDDVLTVPAFPQAARRLAVVLERSGHPALAGRLLEAVAQTLKNEDAVAAAALNAAAAGPWCRAGRRRHAWRLAWSSGSWRALLRCCRPW